MKSYRKFIEEMVEGEVVNRYEETPKEKFLYAGEEHFDNWFRDLDRRTDGKISMPHELHALRTEDPDSHRNLMKELTGHIQKHMGDKWTEDHTARLMLQKAHTKRH
jgi:hypothetical protein